MNLDKHARLVEYQAFCEKTYVPIFSQPWWMDAVCEPENWDVWLYRQGNEVAAAMPYYLENRQGGLYITKACLTQNNGIIFRHNTDASPIALAKFENKAIKEACEFIGQMKLAVYEQQFHYSFTNWLPFFWQKYEAIPRYTFVIEDTSSPDIVWSGISSKQRSCIRKGERNISEIREINPEDFYDLHEKVFLRQNLQCPFSREFWMRLWHACKKNNAAESLCALTDKGEVASLIFLTHDSRSMYHILGGSMPGLQSLDTYDALIWHAIQLAGEKKLVYDFEGSMIERIAKSFREYGGTPKQYFRIRKVFNPDIIRKEAEDKIRKLCPKV